MKNVIIALAASAAFMCSAPLAAEDDVKTTSSSEVNKRSPVFINRDVNTRIRYVSDGRHDDWELPKTEGDCEDFALLKRKMLIEGGWSPDQIELILVVKTDDLQKAAKDGTPITFAHIVVYIPSIDLVLDIPPIGRGSHNSFLRNEYSFNKYLEVWNYSPVCKIADISEGRKKTATERCGYRYPIMQR